jgi:hypothetical protein
MISRCIHFAGNKTGNKTAEMKEKLMTLKLWGSTHSGNINVTFYGINIREHKSDTSYAYH